jgi:hypoxanthine phosphoribosyltransferase
MLSAPLQLRPGGPRPAHDDFSRPVIQDIDHILIDEQRIAARVRELGRQIAADLQREFVGHRGTSEPGVSIVPIMTGALVFTADLIRQLPFKLRMELLAVSSYPGKSVASKGVSLRSSLPSTLEGTHVLLVDDILDSGQTMHVVSGLIRERGAASLRTCVLLRKPGKAVVDFTPDYVGFDIPDAFVVGYGLDYDGHYRNLPNIAVVKGALA